MRSFDFKLAGMRKPQNWVVCPVSNNTDGSIYAQSDKSIVKFDPTTGNGVLNTKGCYFHHLNEMLGAKPFVFPQEFITLCKDNSSKSGDAIGSIGIVIIA